MNGRENKRERERTERDIKRERERERERESGREREEGVKIYSNSSEKLFQNKEERKKPS